MNSELSYGALLPTFNVTANKSFSNTDVTQQLASGGEARKIDNAKTSNLNLSPTLNWTVFDGLGMFHTRNRLKTLAQVGEDDLRLQIENSIAQISNAFYRVVLENERARVFQIALDLSRKRLELAKTRYEVGKASKLVFLQAQVDYNTDSSNYLTQRELIHNVLVEMNRLLGQDLERNYEISAGLKKLSHCSEKRFLDLLAYMEMKFWRLPPHTAAWVHCSNLRANFPRRRIGTARRWLSASEN